MIVPLTHMCVGIIRTDECKVNRNILSIMTDIYQKYVHKNYKNYK
jgi:hypothetical protein